jgi:hypothetical protein
MSTQRELNFEQIFSSAEPRLLKISQLRAAGTNLAKVRERLTFDQVPGTSERLGGRQQITGIRTVVGKVDAAAKFKQVQVLRPSLQGVTSRMAHDLRTTGIRAAHRGAQQSPQIRHIDLQHACGPIWRLIHPERLDQRIP